MARCRRDPLVVHPATALPYPLDRRDPSPSVPASSAYIERVFSVVGDLTGDHRRLSPVRLQQLLIIRLNSELAWQVVDETFALYERSPAADEIFVASNEAPAAAADADGDSESEDE